MPVPWWMYLAIIILGLTTIYMISYGFHKELQMVAMHAPLADAAMEVKLEATGSCNNSAVGSQFKASLIRVSRPACGCP